MPGVIVASSLEGEGGYSIAEALAAMFVISLAMVGLFEGARIINHAQAQIETRSKMSEGQLRLQSSLERLFAEAGPFGSTGDGQFVGNPRELSFSCSGTVNCRVQIHEHVVQIVGADGHLSRYDLGKGRRLMLSYIGSREVADNWPPPNPSDFQSLRAIVISEAGTRSSPVATARVWREIDDRAPVSSQSLKVGTP